MGSRILIVDDDPSVLRMLERALQEDGYAVRAVASAEEAIPLVAEETFDAVISDLTLPSLDGLALLRALRVDHPDLPFILLTGHGTVQTAVQAMKDGAYHYLEKPVDHGALRLVLNRATEQSELVREVRRLRQASDRRMGRENILGKSKRMQTVFDLLGRVAPSSSTVLIQGESGTGKELIARAIHAESQRHQRAFIPINVAGLPEPLLESELFGHVKGAFTGAATAKKGLFEEAHGGTLFLDEIGEMSLAMQAKLLRVLQEGEIRPVGGNEIRRVDVRLLCATNRDLKAAVAARTFREDLYYRIAVIVLQVPPLRERPEDIPLLAHHFREKYAAENNRTIGGIHPQALQRLIEHPWLGNVRELENAIERAVVVAEGGEIRLEHLPPEVRGTGLPPSLPQPPAETSPLKDRVQTAVARVEREAILRALRECGGNKVAACTRLGISRASLYNKMREYGIPMDTPTPAPAGRPAEASAAPGAPGQRPR